MRIEGDLFRKILREQLRLTEIEGRKPTYSELLGRAWDAYEARREATGGAPAQPRLVPAPGFSDPKMADLWKMLIYIAKSGDMEGLRQDLELRSFAAARTPPGTTREQKLAVIRDAIRHMDHEGAESAETAPEDDRRQRRELFGT